MSHYCYHHHFNREKILKKNFDKEYQYLTLKYGKENIELEKELPFAYWYKCWINEADGEWIFDSLIGEYVYIFDSERINYNE